MCRSICHNCGGSGVDNSLLGKCCVCEGWGEVSIECEECVDHDECVLNSDKGIDFSDIPELDGNFWDNAEIIPPKENS